MKFIAAYRWWVESETRGTFTGFAVASAAYIAFCLISGAMQRLGY